MSSPGIAVGEPHPTGTSPRGWARSKLFDLFNAHTKEDYDRAFDAFLASNAHVTLNGEKLSREEYKERMLQAAPLINTKHVRFDAEVEEQAEPELEGNKAGFVGVICTVNVEWFGFPGPEADYIISLSLNLVIKHVPYLKTEHGTDGRRVVALNQIMATTKANVKPRVEPAAEA